MTQRWQLAFGDQIFGPYERLELEALRADSRLAPASLEGPSGSWRPAGEVALLAEPFAGDVSAGGAKPARIAGELAGIALPLSDPHLVDPAAAHGDRRPDQPLGHRLADHRRGQHPADLVAKGWVLVGRLRALAGPTGAAVSVP